MIEKIHLITSILKLFISINTTKKTLFLIILLIKYMGLKGIDMSLS